jgi:hypothetical protein
MITAALVACGGEPTVDEAPGEDGVATGGVQAQGAAPPAARGRCDAGFDRPQPGTELFSDPLAIIANVMGVPAAFDVAEMRYFTGPESPPSDKGYLKVVERWYVKGQLSSDPSVRGRWIVERREFGSGLVAVAPWETEGYRSPDWYGFQFDSADPTRRRYGSLPGRWGGVPYDFVLGGAGLDNPGLPLEVSGCLTGT